VVKKLLPITLGIARSAGNTQNLTEARQAQALEMRRKAFVRDEFTCQCCGFQSSKYQDILYLNGREEDYRLENMKTVCIFCHQCFNLDQVPHMRSGVLIWLPEITQAELHHLVRAIYVARISQGPVADAARRALEVLMKRREDARARLGTDDPYILATVLQDYISNKAYDVRSKKLDGLRLLPLDRRVIKEADLEFNQFPQILAFWRSKDGPFGGVPPKNWLLIYDRVINPDKAA
jgi:intracellular multiplication protein IcmJ